MSHKVYFIGQANEAKRSSRGKHICNFLLSLRPHTGVTFEASGLIFQAIRWPLNFIRLFNVRLPRSNNVFFFGSLEFKSVVKREFRDRNNFPGVGVE